MKELQRVASIPYEQRAEIIVPILNKMLDNKIEADKLVENHKNEMGNIKIEYGEL